MTDQVRAVTAVLASSSVPLSEGDIASHFAGRGAWRARLKQLIEMLATLGRIREISGRFVSAA